MNLLLELILNPIRANGDINGLAIMFYTGLALLVACWLIERSFNNKQ